MLTSDHLFQAFEATGAQGRVVYLSVPITSGLREIQLLRELELSHQEFRSRHYDRWRREVVGPNEREALELAEALRSIPGNEFVVDPSRLVVAGWEQDDYNSFWMRLLGRYAVRIVAAQDWEFSRGARGEIAYGLALGLPVVTVLGEAITDLEAVAADLVARERLLADGWSADAIERYLPPLDLRAPMPVEVGAASQTFDWLAQERSYQVQKFGTDQDDKHTVEGLGEDSWWWRQLTSYFHRARVLTLETPVGRQALAKYVATACGLLESVVRTHGPLPPPGVPSGQVKSEQ